MRITSLISLCLLAIGSLTLFGCSASHHAAETQKGLQGDQVTVGVVQREIKKGMSSAEVVEELGSPNVVSTDEQGREVWVYDKIATDKVYSKGGLFISTGAASTSQRTLTIVIKFDRNNKVRDYAYHSSRF